MSLDQNNLDPDAFDLKVKETIYTVFAQEARRPALGEVARILE